MPDHSKTTENPLDVVNQQADDEGDCGASQKQSLKINYNALCDDCMRQWKVNHQFNVDWRRSMKLLLRVNLLLVS